MPEVETQTKRDLSRPFWTRRSWLLGFVGLAASSQSYGKTVPLEFRLLPEGWGHSAPEELRAVLASAAGALWPYFPDRASPKFVVQRGTAGPIVHFQRNVAGETVMQLDTQDRHWAQAVYQFSHEFCHILANFDEDYTGNLWFEEALCETASLFALKTLGRAWRERPPYPNWQSYAAELEKYAQEVIKSRKPLNFNDLQAFCAKNEAKLRTNPTNRALTGSVAVALLPHFEAVPQRWEAVTWLNSKPSPSGESFPEYLDKWESAAPSRHKAFIGMLRKFLLGSSY
jgi:hypothetical protein